MLTDPPAFLCLSSTFHWSSTSYSPLLSNPVCLHSSWGVEAEAGGSPERRKGSYAIETVMEVRLLEDQQPCSREGGFRGRVGNEAWDVGVGQSVKESLLEKRWEGGSYLSLSDRKVADVWSLLAVTGSCWLFPWRWPFWLRRIVALICVHLMAMFSGIYCHLYFFWDLSIHFSIYWLDYLFLWSSVISVLYVFFAFSVYRDEREQLAGHLFLLELSPLLGRALQPRAVALWFMPVPWTVRVL